MDKEKDLYHLVTDLIIEMGIPAHLNGYHFLRAAIVAAAQDMEKVGSVTKLLYPVVAKEFNTTEQKVERAIRNAIEASWKRGSTSLIEELFGYTATADKRRPTNSEYIATIADKMNLDMRK